MIASPIACPVIAMSIGSFQLTVSMPEARHALTHGKTVSTAYGFATYAPTPFCGSKCYKVVPSDSRPIARTATAIEALAVLLDL